MEWANTNLSKVGIVGLILFGHEKQEDPVVELKPVEGGDAHEEEDAVEDGHGDPAEHGGQEDAHPDQDEHQHGRHALLPELTLKCRKATFVPLNTL